MKDFVRGVAARFVGALTIVLVACLVLTAVSQIDAPGFPAYEDRGVRAAHEVADLAEGLDHVTGTTVRQGEERNLAPDEAVTIVSVGSTWDLGAVQETVEHLSSWLADDRLHSPVSVYVFTGDSLIRVSSLPFENERYIQLTDRALELGAAAVCVNARGLYHAGTAPTMPVRLGAALVATRAETDPSVLDAALLDEFGPVATIVRNLEWDWLASASN